MGFSWPSLGRWTSRRTQSPEVSLEPLRTVPAGHATTTTACYSPNGGNHNVSSSGFTQYDETSSSISSPSSSPTNEHHQQSAIGPFEVRTYGVEETEALLRGESSQALFALLQRQTEAKQRVRSERNEVSSRFWARTPSFAWKRNQEKTTSQQKQQRRRDHENYLHHHCDHQPYKDAYHKEKYDGTKEVNHCQHWEDAATLDEGADGANAGRRSETQRKSLAGTAEALMDNAPCLPCLCFPEFGRMVEEAEISSTTEGSAVPTPGHMQNVETGASLGGSPAPKGRLLSCLDDFSEKKVVGYEGPEWLTKDRVDMYRPTCDEFEGWQMDEEDEGPHEMSYDIPRPATGLGWYEDDESSVNSIIDHVGSRLNERYSDVSTETIIVKPQHFPVRKDSLQSSSLARSFIRASSLDEVGDAPTTGEHNSGEPNTSMSTVIDNTNCFLQSDTEDDDWLGPKPVRGGSVSYDNVERASNSLLDDSDRVSPTSSIFPPASSEEEEIDGLLDIYATCSDRETLPLTPSDQESNLPPYPSHHSSALGPLLAIARGLSLPPTTSFLALQEHLARNANILRYLALHCIPSPSISSIEHTTDLVEPILPPPLPQYPFFAQNYPHHPRRREYTRLLQAIRSVRWSADAINDMLAVIDFNPPPPGRGRPSTALPMFRKLRAADAQRKGYLTSAQLHRLHCHGLSLLDLLQMNDIPKVVTRGLGGRLVEAAESGALGIARECNLLDEEGALLELLADPDDLILKSPGRERRGWAGKGSGLRNCVGIDEDEKEATGDWGEGYDEETFVRSFVEDDCRGHGVDDIPYTVSPLSPEATTGEKSWDQRDVSPLTTSYRIQELVTLFHEVRSLSSVQNCQTDETAPDRGHTTPERTHGFQTCRDRSVLVVKEAARSPEMHRLFREIGVAPVTFDSNVPEDPTVQEAGFGNEDSRLALRNKSWGVDLGGTLSD
ncbi:hypothetical protein CI238_03339 [Colletotrichum incanum]|uniref:Uncharacterized protein n=1 Tax=Colletotrichum incanum TaxID=1573173 RepID=A0A167B9T9_COLIC|nr:hypothetical protein CI238_03339 [Colletotrichum incanum]